MRGRLEAVVEEMEGRLSELQKRKRSEVRRRRRRRRWWWMREY